MVLQQKTTTTTDEELIEFVYQSNAIEGYLPEDNGPGSIVYDRHLSTAKWIVENNSNPETWEPNILHFRLMQGQLAISEVGVTRNKRVFIGGHEAPEPGIHLAEHWVQWRHLLNGNPSALGLSPESYCWKIHNEFECLHPYVDGNGRTGRLILNALRLYYGLPWLTIHVGKEQKAYYDYLSWYWRKRFICQYKV